MKSAYFHEKSFLTSGEYTCDANGNMVAYANKGITQIVYNHLNLPTEIFFEQARKFLTFTMHPEIN